MEGVSTAKGLTYVVMYCREREILAREIALSTERGVHIVVKNNYYLYYIRDKDLITESVD